MKLTQEIARRLDPPTYSEVPVLRESVSRLRETVSTLREDLHAFASMQQEDREWIGLRNQHDSMSWTVIQQIIRVARMYYALNPIIKRAVSLRTFYAFGRGVEIRVEDQDGITNEKGMDKLKAFIEANRLMSTLGMGEADTSLQTDGNLFLCLATDPSSGTVRLRQISALEIRERVTEPGDAETPLYYLRSWTETNMEGMQEQKEAYYPALGAMPAAEFRGKPVMLNYWVIHESEGKPFPMGFGMPTFYAAMAPASDYRHFVNSWVIVQQALRRFALEVETKGGERAVTAVADRLNTNLSSSSRDPNPPPNTGAAFVHGPGAKINAVKTAGATDSPDEARALFLFAIMSLHFPEHMFGDPATGNLATAKTLDRPTELYIQSVQERWTRILKRVVGFAIEQQRVASGGELRQEPGDLRVIVSFPPVLEHDLKDLADSLVSLSTLNGQQFAGTIDPRTFLLKALHILGFSDVETLASAIFGTDYDPADWAPQTPEERQAQADAMADRQAQANATKRAGTQAEAYLLQVLDGLGKALKERQ